MCYTTVFKSKLFSFCAILSFFISHGVALEKDLSAHEQQLVNHVIKSIEAAEKLQSKITPAILKIPGMSGTKGRHFLNNLCSLPNATYLEIGSWKGSTLIAALYGNEASLIDAIAIDNWSQFESPKKDFFANVQQFLPNSRILRIHEADCFYFEQDKLFLRPINIYFYDGNHDTHSQEKAFTHFNNIFDTTFIAVIDDWNWGHVREGTFSAFKKLGHKILFERQLFTNANGDGDGWWNGMYVGVIRK